MKAVTRIAKQKTPCQACGFPSFDIKTEKRVRVVRDEKEETPRYFTILQSTTCGE